MASNVDERYRTSRSKFLAGYKLGPEETNKQKTKKRLRAVVRCTRVVLDKISDAFVHGGRKISMNVSSLKNKVFGTDEDDNVSPRLD